MTANSEKAVQYERLVSKVLCPVKDEIKKALDLVAEMRSLTMLDLHVKKEISEIH